MSGFPTDAVRLTTLVRRAANLVGAAVVAWLVLFFVSSEIPAFRVVSPWSDDPADLVVSLTFLLLCVVGPVTFIRVQQDAGAAVMRARTADDVLRGLYVAVGAVAIADATMLIAWERSGPSSAPALFAALLGISAATAAVAGIVVVYVARTTVAWRRTATDEARDAFDDILAWASRIGPLRGRVAPLQAFLDGPASPRRHRWGFAFVVAIGFGLSYSAWHLIVEGPAPDLRAALAITLVFAAFGAIAVLAAWAAFGGYLRLVRSAR